MGRHCTHAAVMQPALRSVSTRAIASAETEAEVQKGQESCPRSRSLGAADVRLEPRNSADLETKGGTMPLPRGAPALAFGSKPRISRQRQGPSPEGQSTASAQWEAPWVHRDFPRQDEQWPTWPLPRAGGQGHLLADCLNPLAEWTMT